MSASAPGFAPDPDVVAGHARQIGSLLSQREEVNAGLARALGEARAQGVDASALLHVLLQESRGGDLDAVLRHDANCELYRVALGLDTVDDYLERALAAHRRNGAFP